jgi:hypothetical protein
MDIGVLVVDPTSTPMHATVTIHSMSKALHNVAVVDCSVGGEDPSAVGRGTTPSCPVIVWQQQQQQQARYFKVNLRQTCKIQTLFFKHQVT